MRDFRRDISLGQFSPEELPQFVRLSHNHFAAAFPLMKLIPARFVIEAAESSGALRPGATIVESTSGSFGLALAILAAARGYKLIVVGDSAIDPYLERRLVSLGATVDRVDPAIEAMVGPQVARVRRVVELTRGRLNSFWPKQYSNPANSKAYQLLANMILARFHDVGCLVGTVGTGGSMSGTARALRRGAPGLKVVGVDTHGSVLFGAKAGKRLLRGLGNSLIPENLSHEQFDEIHWVTAAEAYAAANALHRDHGLFMGGTSGAAYLAGRWVAETNPRTTVVSILPDQGHRYVETVYNPEWLESLDGWAEVDMSSAKPHKIQHPTKLTDRWCWMPWEGRSLSDIQIEPEPTSQDVMQLAFAHHREVA